MVPERLWYQLCLSAHSMCLCPHLTVLVCLCSSTPRTEIPARIIEYEPEAEASEGQLAVLKCAVEGNPAPQVIWTHDGRQVSQVTRQRAEMGQDSGMTHLSGIYCASVYPTRTMTRQPRICAYSVVCTSPYEPRRCICRSRYVDPVPTELHRCVIGHTAKLPRGAAPPAPPIPHVRSPPILLPPSQIDSNRGRYRLERNGTLVIVGVQRDDGGEYRCRADNRLAAPDTRTVTLTVLGERTMSKH